MALTVAITAFAIWHQPSAKPTSTTVDSIKYRLGSEVLVSNDTGGGVLRCEPSAAIFKDIIVVAWNDSYGGARGSQTGVAVGWAISKNRGRTFSFGGYLPESQPNFMPSGADSWLGADAAGNFYLQVLSWQKQTHHIQLYYMAQGDLGRWRKMPDALLSERAGGGASLDKPAMAVDGVGRIGIAYTSEQDGSAISFLLSTDKGQSWTKPVAVSAKSENLKTGASITMRGNQILVSWMEGGGLSLNQVWYAMSKDGGRSFTSPSMIYRLKDSLRPPKGYALGVGPAGFISNNTWLSNISRGRDITTFYLACTEGEGKGSRILLFTLAPGADTWSRPMQLGESAGALVRVFPSMTTAGEKLAILHYYRGDTADTLTDVYFSVLVGGGSFQHIKMNTISSDWAKVPGDKQFAPIQRNFGDYITLASHGNVFVATWTDGRDGLPRIYARTIEVE